MASTFRKSYVVLIALCFQQSVLVAASSFNVAAVELVTLNSSVHGRLFQGRPVSLPCFSSYNGQTHSVDNASCTTVQDGYTTPEFRTPNFGAYMQPQWETCQSTLEQCLLDDTDPQDPLAFTNTTCRQGSVAPYYIDVREAADVQAAFAFSNKTGVKLSIKNSGHDYKGRSSGQNTLGLWVHNLNSTSYDSAFVPQGCSNESTFMAITTGTGAPWEQVYNFADANNVTIIGGYHQTIAAGGGWLMGGGHSVLSPVFGLGVDRVLEIEIVTPDGKVRTVNSCQDNDLFWALRGGGGSTFGVILSATYKVEPQLSLQVASLAFTPTSENLPDFYSVVVNNSFQWGQDGWGGHVAGPTLVYVNPLLNLSQAQASMKPISDWILSQNGTVTIETVPSWNAFFQGFVLSAEVGVGIPLALTTRLIPKSLFQTDEGRAQLLNLLLTASKTNLAYIPVVAPVIFNATANSTSVTPAWRDALWHMGLDVTWNFNTSKSTIEDNYSLIHNFTETLRAVAPNSGAYFNEGDVYEPDHETSYWGPNYPRLLEIKKKYDPNQLLSCWQCVGWEGPSDERFSCYLPKPSS